MKKYLFLSLFLSVTLIICCFSGCSKEATFQVDESINTQSQLESADSEDISIVEEDAGEKPVPWHEAKNHIGSTITVYGKIVQAYDYRAGNESTTYLYMGSSPPKHDAIKIIVPSESRINFPESITGIYIDKTLYIYGLIQQVDDELQIEVNTPEQIKE